MTVIKLRRGSAVEWATTNPVLADGEPGFERDTGKHKIGDGVTPWLELEYFLPQSALSGLFVAIRDTAPDPSVSPFWADSSSTPPVLRIWNGIEWDAVGV